MPEAEGFSDKAADFLGSAAGDVFNAYRLGIGSGATALGKSILEKTGGSLLGKAVAAGADNALLNLPQNVVNGLAKSEDPADAVKNIGTSELMDFTAGGLLGGVSSALLKPVKALGEAADDSAIDAILKNATKVDQTANTVYNESIGKELPDALRSGNVMEGALSDAKSAELLPESIGKLGGAAKSDSVVDQLWHDATKSDNVLDEGAGDVGKIINEIKYQPSSGAIFKANPDKTTTILGSFDRDMKNIVNEMGNVKSTYFGAKQGGFNVLNVPDNMYKSADQFWNDVNKPWLDKVINRGDDIVLATKPAGRAISYIDINTGKEKITGFGREYKYLLDNGYCYDALTNMMIKK